ncbi:hypothetical protein [Mycoplasma sp. 613B]
MILNIAVIVLGSLLGFILLIVIIWRLYEKIKGKTRNFNSSKIGNTSKKTLEKLLIFDSLNDSLTLSNILVKNNFSKKGYSLFSGVVLTKEKIYLISDYVSLDNYEKILIDEKGVFLQKNNKSFKKDLWETYWLNESSRWLEKRFKDKYEILILVDENVNSDLIENKTKYRFIDIYSLNKEIETQSQTLMNPKKVSEIFLKNNLFKKEDSK